MKGTDIKKILLFTIVLSTLLLADEPYNITNAKFGAYSFKTQTKMRIYKNSFTAFNLPIEINSQRGALIETKTGYSAKSTVLIAFTAIKNDKMSIKTERLSEYSKYHQLTKVTEVINRNGETQTVVCTPLRDELIDQNHNKMIGCKSDVLILNCDDGNQMKMQSQVQKSAVEGLANYTTKKNFMMKYNGISYKIEETRKISINAEGSIKRIAEKVKVKDLFSIKYKTIDIVQ